MTSAHLPDSSTVTYRYDALGRRVEQSSAVGATRYVNLGANVVAEYDGSNAVRASYVTTIGSGNLPGMPFESTVGGDTKYSLLDGVGSVTGTTDASGALTSVGYTACGTPVGASSGTYSYGTYGYDAATGLYYARARYYDPAAGRFLSEDPAGNVNPYVYAESSPSVAGDPTGRDQLDETGTIEATVAVRASVFSNLSPAWLAMIGATAACLGDSIYQLQKKGTIDPIELLVFTIAGGLAGPTIAGLGVWRGIVFGVVWSFDSQAGSNLITGHKDGPIDYVEGALLGAVPAQGPWQLVWPTFSGLLQWAIDRLRGAVPQL
jgi:RHS repeat-associated protein